MGPRKSYKDYMGLGMNVYALIERLIDVLTNRDTCRVEKEDYAVVIVNKIRHTLEKVGIHTVQEHEAKKMRDSCAQGGENANDRWVQVQLDPRVIEVRMKNPMEDVWTQVQEEWETSFEKEVREKLNGIARRL